MSADNNEKPAMDEQQVKAMMDIFEPLFNRKAEEGTIELLTAVAVCHHSIHHLCRSLDALRQIGMSLEEIQTLADVAVATCGKTMPMEEISAMVKKVGEKKS